MNSDLESKLQSFDEAAKLLLNGGVGIIPTDTVYGLVALAKDKQAVARLYALKKRERKPGTLIADTLQQFADLGVEPRYLQSVARLWPNPLSVVVPTGQDLYYLHQGLDSLPMRIPKDEQIRSFLEKTGPLLTSSANQPTEPVSNNVQEAWNYFGDSVDFYVEGGDLSSNLPSTLVIVRPDSSIDVLREGAISISELPGLF